MEKLLVNNFVHESIYTGVSREESQVQGFERQATSDAALGKYKVTSG